MKNSALEAHQALRQGGLVYKGGYKGKYQIYNPPQIMTYRQVMGSKSIRI